MNEINFFINITCVSLNTKTEIETLNGFSSTFKQMKMFKESAVAQTKISGTNTLFHVIINLL